MEKFENGEDGVYNLFSEERNCLLTPKITITDKDIEEVPGLKELRAAIESIEEQAKRATGKRKYLLKRDAIDMRKTQYILKSSYRNPITVMPTPSSQGRSQIDLQERKWIDENGEPQSAGLVSLFNPDHVAAILSHYNGLKIQVKGRHWDDFYYLMQDFDKTVEKALINFPIYQRIMQLKINNIQNAEIQEILEKEFNTKYSTVYISSLWCNKIPKLIAETAKEEYLIWYYTYEKPEGAKWKTCSCCGQRKLAHNRFFSKNKSAKDGYYSLCKMCRNKKNKGEEKCK
jgi:hypothetical protein